MYVPFHWPSSSLRCLVVVTVCSNCSWETKITDLHLRPESRSAYRYHGKAQPAQDWNYKSIYKTVLSFQVIMNVLLGVHIHIMCLTLSTRKVVNWTKSTCNYKKTWPYTFVKSWRIWLQTQNQSQCKSLSVSRVCIILEVMYTPDEVWGQD